MKCKARYLKLDLEYSYLNLEVDNRNFKISYKNVYTICRYCVY